MVVNELIGAFRLMRKPPIGRGLAAETRGISSSLASMTITSANDFIVEGALVGIRFDEEVFFEDYFFPVAFLMAAFSLLP